MKKMDTEVIASSLSLLEKERKKRKEKKNEKIIALNEV
jgi:hypothetical protein